MKGYSNPESALCYVSPSKALLHTLLQSHGREVDEEGWNSSGGDSEGVHRSAHSTPQAGGQPDRLRRPFSQVAQPEASTSQGQEELQVASRSHSAFIPRRLKQVSCSLTHHC